MTYRSPRIKVIHVSAIAVLSTKLMIFPKILGT